MRVSKAIIADLQQKPEVLRTWTQRWIGEGFAAVERVVAGEGGPFCFGETPTMADVFLVPAVHIAKVAGVEIAQFPLMCRVEAAAQSHPAFIAAHPSRQQDAS